MIQLLFNYIVKFISIIYITSTHKSRKRIDTIYVHVIIKTKEVKKDEKINPRKQREYEKDL